MQVGRLALWTCLVVLASQAVAAPPERDRLRKLATFPIYPICTTVKYDEAYGVFYLGWAKPDPMTEIVRLRKTLRGTPEDASTFHQIAKLYQTLQMPLPARENFALAAKLYAAQIDGQRGNGWLRAQYADAWSETTDGKRRSEADPVFRQAIQLAPRDWHCWATLGNYLQRSIYLLVVEDAPSPERADPKLRQAELDRLLVEARVCYEHCVELAPQDPQAYAERAFARASLDLTLALLRMRQGEKDVNPYVESMSPACVADLQTVAHLRPNDSQALAVAALVEFLPYSLRQGPAVKGAQDLWNQLSPLTRQSLLNTRATLEKLAGIADLHQGAEARETLGMLNWIIWGDVEKAESDFQTAVALDSTRETSWQMLLLLRSKREDESYVKTCRERLKAQDSPRYHLLLARVYDKADYRPKVEEEVQAALKADPRDFDANLAEAIYVLKYADENTWSNAQAYLMRAAEALRETPAPLRQASYAAAQGFYLALTGNAPEARLRFQQSLQLDNQKESIREALECLDAVGAASIPR